MAVRRIMPYHESPDFDATRSFYAQVLGLEEGQFGGGYIGFGSGQAQVLFAPPGVQPPLPDMGVDVGSRAAVDAAHVEAVGAGHEVISGPVDEPWGVRRFFVRDPQGVVISVLAHDCTRMPPGRPRREAPDRESSKRGPPAGPTEIRKRREAALPEHHPTASQGTDARRACSPLVDNRWLFPRYAGSG